MKTLIDGHWVDRSVEGRTADGSFKRHETTFRNWITEDGSAGPSGKSGFEAESGRYHLYVSLACPWAHRTLIIRLLKGLSEHVGVSVVHPIMAENGWELTNDYPSTTGDPILGKSSIYEIYLEANSCVTSRASVPVLWDKKRGTIVSNESAEIIRMFNSAFDGITGNTEDYYPAVLRSKIDAINTDIYNNINNGVYKTGFSSTQSAYTKSVRALFAQLDQLEELLSKQRYLLGETITEADWREIKENIAVDFIRDSYFSELKEAEIIRERLELLAQLDEYVGNYFSKEWVQKNILRQSDEDIEAMSKQIDVERASGQIPDEDDLEI